MPRTQSAGQQNARARLAALREKKAPTKAGQIRALWPEIKAALDNGQSLKSVCDCLEADGIKISVQTLGSYVTRMRRNTVALETALATTTSQGSSKTGLPALPTTAPATSQAGKLLDPLANVRERQRKRSAFDYRPELADPRISFEPDAASKLSIRFCRDLLHSKRLHRLN
jgi:hypothetical protein